MESFEQRIALVLLSRESTYARNFWLRLELSVDIRLSRGQVRGPLSVIDDSMLWTVIQGWLVLMSDARLKALKAAGLLIAVAAAK